MKEAKIEVSTVIHADPAIIWKTLTQRKSVMFMGADVESDWQIGRPIYFRGGFNGQTYADHGVIRESDPFRSLSFTHFSALSGRPDAPENYNLIRFELAPVQGGTKLTMTQRPMGHGIAETEAEKFRENWEAMLRALKQASEDA